MPQACLVLVEQRETRYRVQWYHKLFESTQRGLIGTQSTEVVHGSMLALGELLRHTGEAQVALGLDARRATALARFGSSAGCLCNSAKDITIGEAYLAAQALLIHLRWLDPCVRSQPTVA